MKILLSCLGAIAAGLSLLATPAGAAIDTSGSTPMASTTAASFNQINLPISDSGVTGSGSRLDSLEPVLIGGSFSFNSPNGFPRLGEIRIFDANNTLIFTSTDLLDSESNNGGSTYLFGAGSGSAASLFSFGLILMFENLDIISSSLNQANFSADARISAVGNSEVPIPGAALLFVGGLAAMRLRRKAA